MDWSGEFARYVERPHEAWPQDRPLQANKLQSCASRLALSRDTSIDEVVRQLAANAERRTLASPPTLFLVNCGSSGSHWIEAMLSALPGIHACGEVYMPPGLGESLATGSDLARRCFMDALHQIHLDEPTRVVEEHDVLINSAHSWGPHDLMGGTASAVLLIRDPVDVVMSRTFRKPKLRRNLSPSASDQQYLEQNMGMVEKFYRSAMRRNPSHLVRYEQARAQPAEVLSGLAKLVGKHAPAGALQTIGERYSAEQQQVEGRRLSNLYRGSKDDASEVRDYVLEKLARLRVDLGYG